MVTAVTSGLIMPAEQLTFAQIAERLSVSPEAARAIVKRHRLPRSRSNDGKTLAAIDLEEIRHKPLPARSPRGPRSVTDVVATLKTGGAYDSHHPTAGIAGCTRRRGGRMAAGGIRTAA